MIECVRHIEGLKKAALPAGEYAIVHSAWLAVMGLRPNGDLDLIVSSGLRNKLFPDTDPGKAVGVPGPHERRIRIQPANSLYGKFYRANGLDDVIANFCVELDGFRFVEPRFYFMFKKLRLGKLLRSRAELPLWRRSFGLPIGVNRAFARKIAKDHKDLRWLGRYFDQELHRCKEFEHLPESAWGLPERDWFPRG